MDRGTYSLTHSLLRLTSEGRSDLHNERYCADDHSESIVHPSSSSTCCVFLGRPGARFQSGTGHLPCERLWLTQYWRILWAGTSGGRRQTCASNECLLSAMMRGRSVSFVWLRTESLVLYVQDAPFCLHVKSLQSGRVGFGQSPQKWSVE